MHVVTLACNAVYYQTVIVQVIENKLIGAFLLSNSFQSLLQLTDLTFLHNAPYYAVVTCNKDDQQKKAQYYPVLVFACKRLEFG